MMLMFHANVSLEQQPEFLIAAAKKYKNNFDKMAEIFYAKSIFASQNALSNFLKNPDIKTLQKDYLYQAAIAFGKNHNKSIELTKVANEKLDKANRLYIDILRKMDSQKTFYPDANFSMRLTYGKVLDYVPTDGVKYNYFTTLKGVMEKEDSSNNEFIVPQRLKDIYNSQDYGLYGEDNTMKVCFLTDNDITGGNSGSPVINGKGELIGLAFDGNWEAMSGDIAYEPELQRTISVDIRYVLLLIDKFANAKNLINEMTLIGKAVN